VVLRLLFLRALVWGEPLTLGSFCERPGLLHACLDMGVVCSAARMHHFYNASRRP
jgi:hypothetical protein